MTAPRLEIELDVILAEDVELEADLDELDRLARFSLESEQTTGDWAVAIVLTSDAHLRRLHAEFMSIDEETDVMTFPTEDDAGRVTGGDVVISVDRAAVQGPEAGLSQFEEIRFLCVHGILHLRGWDDATDEDRTAMHRRQAEIIDAFDRSF